MTLDKALFLFLLRNRPTPELINHLDRIACKCGYIHHWYYNMSIGRWNPGLNEMDIELKDVKTMDQLYEFLISKHNDLQKQPAEP